MTLQVKNLNVGDIVLDSYPLSLSDAKTAAKLAAAIKKDGRATAMALYVGTTKKETIAAVLDAGLGIVPVTTAGAYRDGAISELNWLTYVGFAAVSYGQLNVFLDLEGKNTLGDPVAQTIAQVTTWANDMKSGGVHKQGSYIPAIYFGVPQPLLSKEMWELPVQRYWKGAGRMVDRNNNLAEPTGCGWCMTQMYPSQMVGGVLVDFNMVGQDFKGRVPNAVFA